MHPQALDEGGVGRGLWAGQADPLDDPGEVPQVEQVVGLCGGGQQVLGGLFVHRHCGFNDLSGQPEERLGESKPGGKQSHTKRLNK